MKPIQLFKSIKITIIAVFVILGLNLFLTSCSQKYYAQPNQITFTFKEKPSNEQIVEIVQYFKEAKNVDISALQMNKGELVSTVPIKVGPTPGPRPKPVTLLILREVLNKFSIISEIEVNFRIK